MDKSRKMMLKQTIKLLKQRLQVEQNIVITISKLLEELELELKTLE